MPTQIAIDEHSAKQLAASTHSEWFKREVQKPESDPQHKAWEECLKGEIVDPGKPNYYTVGKWTSPTPRPLIKVRGELSP